MVEESRVGMLFSERIKELTDEAINELCKPYNVRYKGPDFSITLKEIKSTPTYHEWLIWIGAKKE